MMTLKSLLTGFAADPNWLRFETERFVLHARREILVSGRGDHPLPSIGPEENCWEVFQGLREDWWKELTEQAASIDREHFTGEEFVHRKNPVRVAVVFWDVNYAWPVAEHAGPLSAEAKEDGDVRIKLPLPVTIPIEAADDDAEQPDYVIVIPLPKECYWGAARLEWLRGSLAHEMFHVWSAWAGPGPLLLSFQTPNPWSILDEASAVWAEFTWVKNCHTGLDYAVSWFHQSGVSLYGGGSRSSKPAFPNDALGYNQFVFLLWLQSEAPGMVKTIWRKGRENPTQMDPWKCLNEAIDDAHEGQTLEAWYARFAAAAYTEEFRERHFSNHHGQWYLKAIEEVFDLTDAKASRSFTGHLPPLSKRAFLLRMDGRQARTVRLKQTEEGFCLHVVEEDGRGKRCSVLESVGTRPPYQVNIPASAFAVIVVSYSKLPDEDDPAAAPPDGNRPAGQPITQVTPKRFDLMIE